MEQEERIAKAVAHLEATYRVHKNDLIRSAYKVLKNNDLAKDVVQSTFEKALKSIMSGNYQPQGKMISWLYVSTHNMAIDEIRRKKKRAETSFDVGLVKEASPSAEDRLSFEDTKIDLWRFVRMLPKDQFDVIMMRYPKNGNPSTKFAKIARIFGVSINTVTGRTRYALKNLRKLLKREHSLHNKKNTNE